MLQLYYKVLEKPWKIKLVTEFFRRGQRFMGKVRKMENMLKEKAGLFV